MSLRAMSYAIQQQNIIASWRGDTPTSGVQITAEYCAEEYMGLPRLQYGEDETNELNLTQLATDYDNALVYIAAKEAEKATVAADREAVLADSILRALMNASPTQIETYITNNVTDLVSARRVLIKLAQAISAVAREQFM